MKTQSVIRAWKDEEYRLSLSKAERALLPEHPAGAIELTDAELGAAAGGALVPQSTVCPSVGLPCISWRISLCCIIHLP